MAVTAEEIGQRIGAWRTQRGMSQVQLAASVDGLDQSKLSRIESGTRRLSSVELADIAAALRIDPLDLLDETPVSSALIAARGTTQTEGTAVAVSRGVDVLRTWRLLEADGFEVRVGAKPHLGDLMLIPVAAGNVAAMRLRDCMQLGDQPITDLMDLAEAVGLIVAYGPVPGRVDGVCIGDGDHGVTYINTDNWGSRQRFTIAHEIAHWVLGDVSDEARADEDVYHTEGDAAEVRANAFAAQLLAPDSAVTRLRGASHDDAVRFAYDYGVSLPTLSWRIHNTYRDKALSTWLRSAPSYRAADAADRRKEYERDADARNRAGVSFAFEQVARRAHSDGALSERHLSAVIPHAGDEPGGPGQ